MGKGQGVDQGSDGPKGESQELRTRWTQKIGVKLFGTRKDGGCNGGGKDSWRVIKPRRRRRKSNIFQS